MHLLHIAVLRSLCIIAILLSTLALSAQVFQNLDFSQRCDSMKTGLCHWGQSWGKDHCCKQSGEIGNTFLKLTGTSENSVGFVEQELVLDTLTDLLIITVSASVRTIDVIGKGAGLNFGVYNDHDELIATRDMGGFYSQSWLQGTHPWQTATIQLVCPEGGRKFKVGAILFGSGSAHFNDFDVQISKAWPGDSQVHLPSTTSALLSIPSQDIHSYVILSILTTSGVMP